MKTLNQDDFFRIQTLIIENMAMNHEEGKQSRYFRRLAKLLAKINEVSGYERKFKVSLEKFEVLCCPSCLENHKDASWYEQIKNY